MRIFKILRLYIFSQKWVILVLSLISNLSSNLYAQNDNIKFERITIEEGLSQNGVQHIIQDKDGFMWLGTQHGLNKYDGNSITVYKHEQGNPNSLGGNNIFAIHEDSQGYIWIGSDGGGLNKFDRMTEKFTHYKHQPSESGQHLSNSLSNNFVQVIYEDRSGMLWVGTVDGLNKLALYQDEQSNRKKKDAPGNTFIHYKNDPNDPNSLSNNDIKAIYEDQFGMLWVGTVFGLNRFDQSTGKFTRYHNDPQTLHSLSHNTILAINEDHTGALWVGTLDGLNRYDRASQRFICYQNDPKKPNSLSYNEISYIYEDSRRTLWIATNGGGLNRFDHAEEKFIHYKNDAADPNSLSGNRIHSIYEDRSGTLWIGTWASGVNRSNLVKKQFRHYKKIQNNPNSLTHNSVYAIYEDNLETLWVGTTDGLNQLDNKTGKFTHYRHNPQNSNSLTSSRVWAICKDPHEPEKILWIGTNKGINRFERTKNRFTRYRHNPQDPASVGHDRIYNLYADSRETLWVGTDGGGLNQFDYETGSFIHYQHNPQDPYSLSGNQVCIIIEDHLGNIWAGTNEGISRFDRKTKQFTNYKNDPNNPNSVSRSTVWSLLEDSSGNLWIGTSDNGLDRFDPVTKRFTHFTEKDGLPNTWIYAILEDDHGNLWLTHNRGLSRFDPKTQTFKNYDVTDGLQSDEFNHAWYKRKNGEMAFGGINGFNVFHPDSIKDNPYVPPVVITDFQVFNKSVEINNDATDSPRGVFLKQHISKTKEIELSYKDYVFSFEFSALHYAAPEKNEYAYIMEGLETQWNYIGNRRFATYTTLPSGDYTFRVKGSNNEGVWNEEGTSIKVIITPPFWQTWWFRLIVAVSILGIAFTWYRMRIRNIEIQKRALEVQVAERTREVQQQNKEIIAQRDNLKIVNDQLGLKTDELEKINVIVKSINTEINFVDLLQSILEETRVINGIDKASALVFDKETRTFKFKATSGWDIKGLENVQMTLEDAEERYIQSSEEIYEDIYIAKNIKGRKSEEKLAHIGIPKSLLIMRVKIEDKVGGYFIFDNMHSENAFDRADIQLIKNLKEHVVSAFIKSRILDDLKTTLQNLEHTQAALIQSEKMSSLGEMMAGVAHEINTPLSRAGKLLFMIKHLVIEKPRNEPIDIDAFQKHVQKGENALGTVSEIVEGLLNFTRQDEKNWFSTDVHELIDSSLLMLKNYYQRHITIHKEYDANQKLECVPAKLNQVFMNILKNAMDAIIPTLGIKGDTFEKGTIEIKTQSANDNIEIRIKDDGIGIKEEDKQKIFDPFYTTKLFKDDTHGVKKGTGLGLSITHRIIEEHNGTIEIETQEGQGTEFVINLPVKRRKHAYTKN